MKIIVAGLSAVKFVKHRRRRARDILKECLMAFVISSHGQRMRTGQLELR